MSSRSPDENPPLAESSPMFTPPQATFRAHPQGASPALCFDPGWHFLNMMPQGPGQLHDGENAAQPLESLVHPSNTSQSTPPEAVQFPDPATGVQVVGDGGGLPLCETCNPVLRRRQESKRHMDEVHQPQRKCPFNPCAYKWKRPDKIKAHITNEHRSELCPEVFQKVWSLRGKGIVEFVDACEFMYNFKAPTEPYISLSLPPLARSENFMLSEYCGCRLGNGDVSSSEGADEQTVGESTVLLPEGM